MRSRVCTIVLLDRQAEKLYQEFVGLLKDRVECVQQGVFRTHMDVSLVNDGPVTLVLDSVLK